MEKIKTKKFNKLLFFIGLSIIVFPFIVRFISSFQQTIVINNYKDKISVMSEEEKISIQENAIEFNHNLYENNEFDNSLSKDSISSVDFSTQDILAYITIPKINVELPIYDGCSDNVLSLGIGHLPNTSLPIGGKNTHSVLVGHTGLTNSIMFDNLDKLKIGDTFFINYLDNVLHYEICQINTVVPENTQNLVIMPEEDLVTLVTCTPKYINTHRLLVTGKRIVLNEYTNDIINSEISNNLTEDNITKDYFLDYFTYTFLINILIIIIFLGLIYYLKIKKKFKIKN